MEIGKKITASDAHDSFMYLLDEVKQYGILITEDDGKPVSIMLSIDAFRSMQAAIYIAADT